MNYLKLLLIIMLNLWLFLQPSTSMALSNCTYTVVNVESWDTLSVRGWPGIKSRKIYGLEPNASGIERTGKSRRLHRDLWVQISYNGITGWVNRSYLRENCSNPIVDPEMGCYYTVINVNNWDKLWVRRWPGIKSRKIYGLEPNASGIERTGKSRRLHRDLWVQISYNGITGWVNSRYLEEYCDRC